MARPKSQVRLAIGSVALGAVVAFPLGVIASHQFTDVPASSTYHDDIAAIKDAGVTTGCALNLYCPKDFVTREQMAAFLNRLGALGPGKTPVVNATKLDGKDSTDYLQFLDVRTQHSGHWLSSTGELPLVVNNAEILDGPGSTMEWFLPLAAATSWGGSAYGLDGVVVCANNSFNAVITRSRLNHGSTVIADDTTDRIAPTCFGLDAAPNSGSSDAYNLQLSITYSAPGSVSVEGVEAVWTPAP